MYSFSLLIIYSANFACLLAWARRKYWLALTCSNLDLLKEESREPPILSSILLLMSAVSMIGWTFWGITDNPYHVGRASYIQAGDDLALLVGVLVAFCSGSFGYLLYKFGQIQAIREHRRNSIDPREKAELFAKIANDLEMEFQKNRNPRLKAK